jgi:hypothetical protein
MLETLRNLVTYSQGECHGHGQDVSVGLLRVALPAELAGLAVGLALLAVPVRRHDGHRRGPRHDAQQRQN